MSKRIIDTVFSKPDEMEMAISHQAMRLTWIIVNIIFVVMAVYFFFSNGQNPIPLLLLVCAEAIYFALKAVMRWRMTKDGADNE